MAVEILLSIALLVISAKVFGEIAERLKIAPLAGEVFGGIVVGYLHLVSPHATLREIANLGILFLLFAIGLNMKGEKGELRTSAFLATAGAALSFALGFLLAFQMFSLTVALVVGAALLSTSSLASMKALMDFGEYRTKVYKTLSSMEIADGFLAILAISLLSSIFSGSANAALLIVLLALLLFALTMGARISNSFLSLFRFMKDEQVFVAIPLVIVFIAAFASGRLGLTAFAGAFLAGLAMSRSSFTESTIMPKIKTIGYGFFIPLFFAYSGLFFDLTTLSNTYWLVALLVIIGLLGKLFGCGFFAQLFGFKWHERKIIGISMLPRGEYSIIIIQLALTAAVITAAVYTALLLFVLASIMLTPLLLRAFAKA